MTGSSSRPYRIIGVESSPYSSKLRAYCRFRRIDHVWVSRMPQFFDETKDLNPVLMPVMQYPDGSYHIDSTLIIEDLESRCAPDRAIHPDDRALAFLSRLVEDFADEWLAKCIFHYRFSYEADRQFGPRWVMDDTYPGATVAELDEYHQRFLQRQLERMPLVGCTPANAALLESTYHEVLAILEPFVALEKFLFGSRPSLADFGMFGALNTLATDPTPRDVMRTAAPRVEIWTMRLADTSGVDGRHTTLENVDPAVLALLALIGDVYLPYLVANAKALHDGRNSFTVRIADSDYRQAPFKYHFKCLEALRKTFAELSSEDRARLQRILSDRNCWQVMSGASRG